MLQVQRTPGNATHEPEPVKQPCTSESCAWRAQVYLQEDVLLEMTFKSDFNLNREHPAAAAAAAPHRTSSHSRPRRLPLRHADFDGLLLPRGQV